MNPESIHHVLGRQVAYPDRYSPDILVRVDRAGNRMAHHIDEVHLPFTGLDLWNAYEVSALTDAGAPVNFIMRLPLYRRKQIAETLLERVQYVPLRSYNRRSGRLLVVDGGARPLGFARNPGRSRCGDTSRSRVAYGNIAGLCV